MHGCQASIGQGGGVQVTKKMTTNCLHPCHNAWKTKHIEVSYSKAEEKRSPESGFEQKVASDSED